MEWVNPALSTARGARFGAMMTTTYTRNLRLRITSGLTTDAVYNLNRLDEAFGSEPFLSLSGNLMLRSPNDITVEPENADLGGSGLLGSINLGLATHRLDNVSTFATNAIFNTVDNRFRNPNLTYTHIIPVATADSTLQLQMNGTVRKINMSGDLTLAGGLTTVGASATFSFPSQWTYSFPAYNGTLATLAGSEIFTNKTLEQPTIDQPQINGGVWSNGGLFTNGNLNDVVMTGSTIGSTPIGVGSPSTGEFTSVHMDNGTIGSGPGVTPLVGESTSQTLSNKTFVACNLNGEQNNLVNIHYGSLTLSNSIVDGDINNFAGIAYSKLNLGNRIVNSDISDVAQIAGYKVVPNFANQQIITQDSIAFYDPGTLHTVSLGPTTPILSSASWRLPSSYGLGGQVIIGDGTGNLSWASVMTSTLFQHRVDIGNSTDERVQVNTSLVGDIFADETTGLTIKAGAILDEDINPSANIVWTKMLALTASKVLVTNASGVTTPSLITAAELLTLPNKVDGNVAITAGTNTKITYDTKGLVTAGTTLSNTDIPNLDAAKIASGVFDIARIPAAAMERRVVVADQTARYALTTASVQNGDTVYQTDVDLMYMVVDATNLGNASGYQVYKAVTDWTVITNKPAWTAQAADGTHDGYLASSDWTKFSTTRYTAALSWTGAGPYAMTITAVTHGRGTDPVIVVRETVGINFSQVLIDAISINAAGDVTLTSNTSIVGKVTIM